jgi:hypothetical protein
LKHKLNIHVQGAGHFLAWELPHFRTYFDVVETPSEDAILFVFGPDALISGASLPAKIRIALLFPGFGYNPYHNLVHRYGMERFINDYYDLVFTNPGPIAEAFASSPKLRLCPFSVNTDIIKLRHYRKKINSLLHASAYAPQKDWSRSRDVMRLSGLKYEVFPPRERTVPQRLYNRIRSYLHNRGFLNSAPLFRIGYEEHQTVIEKYHRYDGFVHIAAETPPYVDGKYTATLLEAGLTGSILFWHDTFNLGNDFETIFSIPCDPKAAAEEILNIRSNIDVESHSKRTVEEVYDRVNPANVMNVRFQAIKELL